MCDGLVIFGQCTLPDSPLYVGDGGLGSSDSCSEKNITGSGSLNLVVKQCLTGSCKVYLRGSDSFRPCMYTLTLSSSSGSSALLGFKSARVEITFQMT